ncbi:electron transfer flavoprotein subunit beta/FixA family protein [Rhizobium leguminosarum]|uniref:electron transfer flavoprotein subunit beta/FixA family protein n=1 Tax=Rhizobium leguminosarum TaxID=384 RepID=UPI0024A8F961|nr:electron transfer flavoprotein subunit beta/FixA family protein [Rhizobium leguminosarum]MDI5929520.1 electron transfer flavoprotein subunit beta/FixA family protein [Rhizobium leguminosarum]
MKILVTVKSVVDYNVTIRVKPDGSGVDLTGVKMSMNPFDEISVEQGVRLRESGAASELIVVSIGSAKSEDALRTALAMGADRAILVETTESVEPLGVAKLVAKVAETEKPDLIIVGKQAIDDDSNQTGQMLSALLNWPQATFASHLSIEAGKASVTREIDGGSQTIEVDLPAVVTTDLRLNEPRYASLPGIMKAKKKPLAKLPASDFSVDLTPRLTVLRTDEPLARKGGVKVGSVAELISKLKTEANVL